MKSLSITFIACLLALVALAFLAGLPSDRAFDLICEMIGYALWATTGSALLFAGVFGGLYAHARVEERRYRKSQRETLIRAALRTEKREPTGPLVVKRPPGLAETDFRQTEGGAR